MTLNDTFRRARRRTICTNGLPGGSHPETLFVALADGQKARSEQTARRWSSEMWLSLAVNRQKTTDDTHIHRTSALHVRTDCQEAAIRTVAVTHNQLPGGGGGVRQPRCGWDTFHRVSRRTKSRIRLPYGKPPGGGRPNNPQTAPSTRLYPEHDIPIGDGGKAMNQNKHVRGSVDPNENGWIEDGRRWNLGPRSPSMARTKQSTKKSQGASGPRNQEGQNPVSILPVDANDMNDPACMVCSNGGSLVSCSQCPASMCLECIPDTARILLNLFTFICPTCHVNDDTLKDTPYSGFFHDGPRGTRVPLFPGGLTVRSDTQMSSNHRVVAPRLGMILLSLSKLPVYGGPAHLAMTFMKGMYHIPERFVERTIVFDIDGVEGGDPQAVGSHYNALAAARAPLPLLTKPPRPPLSGTADVPNRVATAAPSAAGCCARGRRRLRTCQRTWRARSACTRAHSAGTRAGVPTLGMRWVRTRHMARGRTRGACAYVPARHANSGGRVVGGVDALASLLSAAGAVRGKGGAREGQGEGKEGGRRWGDEEEKGELAGTTQLPNWGRVSAVPTAWQVPKSELVMRDSVHRLPTTSNKYSEY
ncbi:hypothetical protein OF83DRAFT_1084757 [Amylostereum chailletii]|nr:hypothetical protein OF83DRAFT_1084757 [Amylostereum chailletii]